MSDKPQRMETDLIHEGEPRPRIEGAVTLPIFQSSTFEFGGESDYDRIRYLRLSNTPNHQALHRKLAALEGGQAALVSASGMAAIATTLLACLDAGDHLLAQDCLYGGTHGLITGEMVRLGMSYDFIRGDAPDSWRRCLKPNTRILYVESITNPLMQVADLEALARFAREHGLISVIDNTFPTPVNFRPLERGFDLSVHSGTKYLNGHSDIVAGAVIGSHGHIRKIHHTANHLGGSLDSHAAFLLHRGIKTLALRVEAQNRSALRLAEFLQAHPGVAGVNYPGLKDHPDHQRACRLFSGFGGMLSFELHGGTEAAERFLKALRLPVNAPSLGGVESLVTRPAATSHVGLSREERRRAGISESLIRLSVGLEAPDDLIRDLESALEAA